MKVLAIDTSGFTASVSIVEQGERVLLLKNSKSLPQDFAWEELPFILPDMHRKFVFAVVDDLLRTKQIDSVDVIAASSFSGIYNCTQIGRTIAESLAKQFNKKLIEVDHILAHHYSAFLERDFSSSKYPILVFSASGSHSDFSLIMDERTHESLSGSSDIDMSGQMTVHVGIGKLFYKMGKVLSDIRTFDGGSTEGLAAFLARANQGDEKRFDFQEFYGGALFDLNFLDFFKKSEGFVYKHKNKATESDLNDLAASFRHSVFKILLEKIRSITTLTQAQEVHVVGGVSASSKLQAMAKTLEGLKILFPRKKDYCLDNAAMIAGLAYWQDKNKIKFGNFIPTVTK